MEQKFFWWAKQPETEIVSEPVTQKAKTKKKKSLTWVILAIVVVVLLGCVGGAVYYINTPEYRTGKAESYLEEGKYEDAAAIFQELIEEGEATSNVKKSLRKAYLGMAEEQRTTGKYEEALKLYEKVLKGDSDNEEAILGKQKVYLALADQKQQEGAHEEALEYFENVLEVDENNEDAIDGKCVTSLEISKIKAEAEEFEEAFDYIESVQEIKGDTEDVYKATAYTYAYMKKPMEAVAYLEGKMTSSNKTELTAYISELKEMVKTMERFDVTTDGKYEVALITQAGGIDDDLRVKNTWKGVENFAKENNITYKSYVPLADSYTAYMNQIELAVKGGAKCIVAEEMNQEMEDDEVITSVMKRYDMSVKTILEAIYNSSFDTYGGKTTRFSAAEHGVDISEDFDGFSSFNKEAYENVYKSLMDGTVNPIYSINPDVDNGEYHVIGEEISKNLKLKKITLEFVNDN